MDLGFVIIVNLFDDLVSCIIMMQGDIGCMVRNIVEVLPPQKNNRFAIVSEVDWDGQPGEEVSHAILLLLPLEERVMKVAK